MRFKLKIADISDEKINAVVKMTLIQNCIAGIREKCMFGLLPRPLFVESSSTEEVNIPNSLTMDVYTSVDKLNEEEKRIHIEKLTNKIQYQWVRLYENLKEEKLLKMTLPKRDLLDNNSVPFDTYRWQQLLRAVSKLFNIENNDEFIRTGFLHQNELNLQLTYQESSPSTFELRVDLGNVPKELDESSVLRSLLIHNHFSGDESGIWWGLHPTDNHVIMVIEHQLSTSEQRFIAPHAHEMLDLIQETIKQSGKLWEKVLLSRRNIKFA
ncbi:hypothetical protein [Limnobacter sp.]|uniref:hypothetical protein n=1 Tax=Limnobacter sp. TaxID=2003368 RepID=UPI002FDF30BC